MLRGVNAVKSRILTAAGRIVCFNPLLYRYGADLADSRLCGQGRSGVPVQFF